MIVYSNISSIDFVFNSYNQGKMEISLDNDSTVDLKKMEFRSKKELKKLEKIPLPGAFSMNIFFHGNEKLLYFS